MDWTQYNNWKEVLDDLEAYYKEKTVVRYMIKKEVIEITGEQLYTEFKKIASALVKLGLQGKRIGLMGTTSYDMLTQLLAALYIGSPAVIIANDSNGSEVKKNGELAEIKAIICQEDLVEVCLEADLGIPVISTTETEFEGVYELGTLKEREICTLENHTGKDDLINIMFTSGTTGDSKAVAHTNSSTIAGYLNDLIYTPFSAVLVIFPLHHVTGFGLLLYGLAHKKILCIADGMVNIFSALAYLKPECTFMVPSVFDMISKKLEASSQAELGWNLKAGICGGTKWPAELLEHGMKLGLAMEQLYGASESCGRGISQICKRGKLDSIGKVNFLMNMKIVDGELVLAGPCVCAGYYRNQAETDATFKDGWYYTGDLARVDEEGYVYLTGRKKNLIILSNGENVSPEEIENKLAASEEIREILVCDIDDKIGAKIYPDYNGCETAEQREAKIEAVKALIEAYNDEAVSYKQIQVVELLDEPLPRTSIGKIKRV